jgi:hypothetical protein
MTNAAITRAERAQAWLPGSVGQVPADAVAQWQTLFAA